MAGLGGVAGFGESQKNLIYNELTASGLRLLSMLKRSSPQPFPHRVALLLMLLGLMFYIFHISQHFVSSNEDYLSIEAQERNASRFLNVRS